MLARSATLALTGGPGVIGKEAIDNALDECEQASVAPKIPSTPAQSRSQFHDNGRGIPRDVVTCILDFSARTSNKRAYISPTRGSQGNGLLLAIPYVLHPDACLPTVIEAASVRHEILVQAIVES